MPVGMEVFSQNTCMRKRSHTTQVGKICVSGRAERRITNRAYHAYRPAGKEAGPHTNLEVQKPLKKHSHKLVKMP